MRAHFFTHTRGGGASRFNQFEIMNRFIEPELVGIKTLILFLFFFDFFSKFLGYQYLSDISPLVEFIDIRIAVTLGDLVFLVLLLNIFGTHIKGYFSVPNVSKSIIYGFSLVVLFLGVMGPVGYLSLKIDQEFFYDYWWGYLNVPIFSYVENLFAINFKIENTIFFICVAVLAPIVEEPLYRVVFYRVFRRRYSPFVSIIFVALLFAIVHPTYFFLAFISSLALSFLIYQTGSVWSAVIAHGVYNSLVFIDAYYIGIEKFKPIESIGNVEAWGVQLVFLPAAIFIIYIFFRNNKNEIREFRAIR